MGLKGQSVVNEVAAGFSFTASRDQITVTVPELSLLGSGISLVDVDGNLEISIPTGEIDTAFRVANGIQSAIGAFNHIRQATAAPVVETSETD